MSLRRFAQTNHASTADDSPRTPRVSMVSPRASGSAPTTPRTRVSFGVHRSPADTPSISSSIPFDWDAARSRRPPPYSTPTRGNAGRKSVGVGAATSGRRAVRREKGLVAKITSVTDDISFMFSQFPSNLPQPAPKTTAYLIGGLMHFTNIWIRVSQIRQVPDSDQGWESMYREVEGSSWFDWTIPMTGLLLTGCIANTLLLFTRVKPYTLNQRNEQDYVSSPNSRFVPAEMNVEHVEPPSISTRLRSGLWRGFVGFWRFLLAMKPPAAPPVVPGRAARVQQLVIWNPGEIESNLFVVYSPVHALLWMAIGSSNWMLIILVMVLVGVQTHSVIHAFEQLVRDRMLVSAESMSEYNKTFVYPRLNPIRKDVAVMTHQSEVVNVWEDEQR
ncbi:hypothetical protein HGRIS_013055 [Hohenbuehelia grisea]|uniref:Nuclear rim protein 1 n=1 Tax=Hohenbuehelia grisea TaxID=104357 RepID=A0ABR3IU77_9AGAR